MNEEEAQQHLKPSRWQIVKNWWKNLSIVWSLKERRLQAHITEFHGLIGDALEKDSK